MGRIQKGSATSYKETPRRQENGGRYIMKKELESLQLQELHDKFQEKIVM